MKNTDYINVDMSHPNAPIKVHAKQHDANTREIVARLYSGDVEYMPSVESVGGVVNIAKPDGTGCYYDVDSISGNIVIFTLVEQALTVSGTAYAEIALIGQNETRLTSFRFAIEIEPRVLDDSEIISSDYYNALLDVSSYIERNAIEILQNTEIDEIMEE